jgi:5-formyltetrahydrofolate cyclo-ligase
MDGLTKRDVRLRAAALRDSLSPAENAARSLKIEERLFAFGPFAAARTVMLFISFRSEVSTGGMIRRSLAAGKRVAVPVVGTKELGIFASQIKDCGAELAEGAYGILEPKPEFLRPVPPEEMDFVALPGLAFDRRGNRIGYGGGFYDRYIATLRPDACLAALAFSLQIFDDVPAAEHDRKIHALITDEELISFGDNRD